MNRPLAALCMLILGLAAAGCSVTATSNTDGPSPTVAWAPTGSPESIAISPDGKTIASRLGTKVLFFDSATGDSVGGVRLDAGCGCDVTTPSNVAFSPDGKQVVAGILSDLYLIDVPSGAIDDTLAVGEPFLPEIHCVSFGPDGRVYVNTQRGDLSVWDSVTGARLLTHPRDPDFFGWTSVVSPDGKTLAVGGNAGPRQAIRLYDTSDLSHYQTLLGDSGFVISLAFAPSSSQLIAGAFFGRQGRPVDQRLAYWDLTQMRTLWTMKTPALYANALALSPDGNLVATGWTSGEIALIDTRVGGVILRWDATSNAGAFDCLFSPDGRALVTSGYDNMIKEWDVAGLLARRGT